MPTLRIQSGIEIQIKPSGSPEEKESSVTARVRREERAKASVRPSRPQNVPAVTAAPDEMEGGVRASPAHHRRRPEPVHGGILYAS